MDRMQRNSVSAFAAASIITAVYTVFRRLLTTSSSEPPKYFTTTDMSALSLIELDTISTCDINDRPAHFGDSLRAHFGDSLSRHFSHSLPDQLVSSPAAQSSFNETVYDHDRGQCMIDMDFYSTATPSASVLPLCLLICCFVTLTLLCLLRKQLATPEIFAWFRYASAAAITQLLYAFGIELFSEPSYFAKLITEVLHLKQTVLLAVFIWSFGAILLWRSIAEPSEQPLIKEDVELGIEREGLLEQQQHLLDLIQEKDRVINRLNEENNSKAEKQLLLIETLKRDLMDYDSVKSEYKSLKSQYASSQSEQQSLKTRNTSLETQRDSLTREYQALKDDHNYLKTTRDFMKNQLDKNSQTLKSVGNSRDYYKAELDKLTSAITKIKYSATENYPPNLKHYVQSVFASTTRSPGEGNNSLDACIRGMNHEEQLLSGVMLAGIKIVDAQRDDIEDERMRTHMDVVLSGMMQHFACSETDAKALYTNFDGTNAGNVQNTQTASEFEADKTSIWKVLDDHLLQTKQILTPSWLDDLKSLLAHAKKFQSSTSANAGTQTVPIEELAETTRQSSAIVSAGTQIQPIEIGSITKEIYTVANAGTQASPAEQLLSTKQSSTTAHAGTLTQSGGERSEIEQSTENASISDSISALIREVRAHLINKTRYGGDAVEKDMIQEGSRLKMVNDHSNLDIITHKMTSMKPDGASANCFSELQTLICVLSFLESAKADMARMDFCKRRNEDISRVADYFSIAFQEAKAIAQPDNKDFPNHKTIEDRESCSCAGCLRLVERMKQLRNHAHDQIVKAAKEAEKAWAGIHDEDARKADLQSKFDVAHAAWIESLGDVTDEPKAMYWKDQLPAQEKFLNKHWQGEFKEQKKRIDAHWQGQLEQQKNQLKEDLQREFEGKEKELNEQWKARLERKEQLSTEHLRRERVKKQKRLSEHRQRVPEQQEEHTQIRPSQETDPEIKAAEDEIAEAHLRLKETQRQGAELDAAETASVLSKDDIRSGARGQLPKCSSETVSQDTIAAYDMASTGPSQNVSNSMARNGSVLSTMPAAESTPEGSDKAGSHTLAAVSSQPLQPGLDGSVHRNGAFPSNNASSRPESAPNVLPQHPAMTCTLSTTAQSVMPATHAASAFTTYNQPAQKSQAPKSAIMGHGHLTQSVFARSSSSSVMDCNPVHNLQSTTPAQSSAVNSGNGQYSQAVDPHTSDIDSDMDCDGFAPDEEMYDEPTADEPSSASDHPQDAVESHAMDTDETMTDRPSQSAEAPQAAATTSSRNYDDVDMSDEPSQSTNTTQSSALPFVWPKSNSQPAQNAALPPLATVMPSAPPPRTSSIGNQPARPAQPVQPVSRDERQRQMQAAELRHKVLLEVIAATRPERNPTNARRTVREEDYMTRNHVVKMCETGVVIDEILELLERSGRTYSYKEKLVRDIKSVRRDPKAILRLHAGDERVKFQQRLANAVLRYTGFYAVLAARQAAQDRHLTTSGVLGTTNALGLHRPAMPNVPVMAHQPAMPHQPGPATPSPPSFGRPSHPNIPSAIDPVNRSTSGACNLIPAATAAYDQQTEQAKPIGPSGAPRNYGSAFKIADRPKDQPDDGNTPTGPSGVTRTPPVNLHVQNWDIGQPNGSSSAGPANDSPPGALHPESPSTVTTHDTNINTQVSSNAQAKRVKHNINSNVEAAFASNMPDGLRERADWTAPYVAPEYQQNSDAAL